MGMRGGACRRRPEGRDERGRARPTFAKIRELSSTIKELAVVKEEGKQKSLMQRSGEIVADIFDEGLQTSDTETSIELNFAVLKFKHTVKRKK